MTASPALFLSIVVPTFRREGYLPALFAALAEQVEGVACPAEVVLVDNSPEAGAAAVAAQAPAMLRYVHEPRSGVAQARNTGVAAARGSHVVFLDDDELPGPGWLAVFAAAAGRGVQAAFGSIDPAYEVPPPADLTAPLERMFSRHLAAAAGADVSGLRAYLGSGNSMFARDLLTRIAPPFDTGFNAGGEDIWLLRQLVDDHGVPLIWCPDARVEELVPAGRATAAFLRRRRYSDGQLRCVIERGAAGWRGALRPGFWMAVGGAQLALCAPAALVARPLSAPLSRRLEMTAAGGAGKLMWWRRQGAG